MATKNRQTTKLLFSAFRIGRSLKENQINHRVTEVKLALHHCDGHVLSYQESVDVYTHLDGSVTEEPSFVVELAFQHEPYIESHLLDWAFLHLNPESVLKVDYLDKASLIFQDGVELKLGRFGLTEDVVENYTKTSDGRIWTVF